LNPFKKFNRVHYHTLVFAIYGILQFIIPYATSFGVLLVLLSILGFLDGVFLTFIDTAAYDISKSSERVNHATGYSNVSIYLES